MGQPMTPATPSTPAQRERYDRVLTTATAILSGGGEEALQMKDLAQRADLSLATLYRYFPSKDHVLLAISLDNYQAAARKVLLEVPRGETARERVANHMLREFRAQQRNQRLTTALTRVLTETSRNYSEIIEVIGHVHQQILQHVAATGPGPFSERQRRLLPVIIDNFSSASRRWQTGVCSAAEARFQIRVGCHLLDLSDAELEAEQELAAPAPALSPA
ncbi:MAG: TetR family transcriptional regulator [Actinomycetota bacterium]|nr:TetR family transcriptional regulator [Actinomycetota bacterium]